MEKISCPVSIGKKCQFLNIAKMRMSEIDPSVSLISKSFPHMNIPEHFWKRKLRFDETLILKENGKNIVGITNISSKNSAIASIDLLVIAPGKQGNGLGSILLDAAEERMKNDGKSIMRLMTEQIKPENVAFYSKKGYKVTGYDPRGYSHSPSVSFIKEL